ncbi:MAG: acyl-CoA/acyl-ACP dehydrogenase [Eggerthellaceae bacterium]|nr:acyl-CoA/acyl-ACP dehydrogenase [Eggerthellaceae bacterium]
MAITTGGEGWYLTDEEWLIRNNLREFVEKEVAPRFRENATSETADPFYYEIMKKLGEQGYLRMCVAPELGGDGQRLTTLLIAVEEVTRGNGALGIHMLENPVLGSQVAAAAPLAWKEKGEGILDGSIIFAAGQTDPAGNGNVPGWKPIAHKNEDGSYTLNGEKAFSSGGTFANYLGIIGLDDEGHNCMFAMEPDTPGLTIQADPEVGNSPTYAHIFMNDVHIEPGYGGPTPFAHGEEAAQASAIAFKAFAVGCGALSLGAASAAWDETVNYLSQRESFGKKVIEYGAIQAKLVDLKIQIESCRSLLYTAAHMIETTNVNAPAWADMAKIACSNMATYVTVQCVDMFGNLGINPDNFIIHHHLDSIGFSIGVGTPDLHVPSAAEELGFPPSDDPARQ